MNIQILRKRLFGSLADYISTLSLDGQEFFNKMHDENSREDWRSYLIPAFRWRLGGQILAIGGKIVVFTAAGAAVLYLILNGGNQL